MVINQSPRTTNSHITETPVLPPHKPLTFQSKPHVSPSATTSLSTSGTTPPSPHIFDTKSKPWGFPSREFSHLCYHFTLPGKCDFTLHFCPPRSQDKSNPLSTKPITFNFEYRHPSLQQLHTEEWTPVFSLTPLTFQNTLILLTHCPFTLHIIPSPPSTKHITVT